MYRYCKTSAPKLQFQWSAATWLVLKVQQSRFLVRSLISPEGRKGKDPVKKWTNVKALKVAGPVPVDFWVGARIRREFRGSWHVGKVVSTDTDQSNTLYKVVYDDCDQEDIDKGQLYDLVAYHPKLDTHRTSHKVHSQVGKGALFAWGQQPRVGRSGPRCHEGWTRDRASSPVETGCQSSEYCTSTLPRLLCG